MNRPARIIDPTQCTLGEGPLWHPGRQQLFWFDIVAHRLYTLDHGQRRMWQFDRFVSAAGWIDDNSLLIASERDLFRFDLTTGVRESLVPLEADNPTTRSNDGRADPHGGFWIGTMGKQAETGAGAIHRYFRGELRRLFADISISNSICFAPDGDRAYFCDSVTGKIMQVGLDDSGWPVGAPDVFVSVDTGSPDGSVTDAAGNLWNAQWGAGRVACYAPDGRLLLSVPVAAAQPSCPAFGGADLTTLYVTTAGEGLDSAELARNQGNGATFAAEGAGQGRPEPGVIL